MKPLAVDVKFDRAAFSLDVNVDIPAEGITVLLGPSGSGKTTLMRLIAGLEKAKAGSVSLAETTWFDHQERIDVPLRKRKVGIVFQDYALFQNMTVAQNIGFGVAKNERERVAATWIERLDLSGLADRYPAQLSGGQRQRVALARTLATDPDLLLLDEPFSAVDAHLRQNLRAQLMGLVAAVKKPAILVTHDLDEARQVADWIGVMTSGRLARFGAAHDIFNDPGEYAAASVLGWRNLLPLNMWKDGCVSGPWGQLAVSGVPLIAKWLGIRAEHIGLGPGSYEGCALQVKAVRCRELGAIRELQCRLPDNTMLYVHRPWNTPLPAPGETLTVHLPVQYLRPLGEGTSLAQLRLSHSRDNSQCPPLTTLHEPDTQSTGVL